MAEASPRFRQDLIAQATQADGVPCVDVRDPATGTNFRFYDFEYQLALQLNGRPLTAVSRWASTTYGVDLTADGIAEFARRLAELGFLERDAGHAHGAAPSEALENAEAEWMTVEGAKTAQFVPDPSMLDSAPSEKTPVAPVLPGMTGGSASRVEDGTPDPAVVATPPPVTLPPPAMTPPPVTLPEAALTPPPVTLPEAALTPPPVTPPPTLTPPPMTLPPEPAIGLASTMLAPPPAAAGRAQNTADAASQPWNRSAPAGGIPERRQPPQPESVVMTGFTEDAPPNVALRGQRGGKRSAVIAIVMLLVLAAAVIGYLTWSRQRAPQPQAVRVHVLSPVPTAVYRWFSGSGSVVDDEARVLAFATPGRLAELVPAGTEFAPSEILGRLSGAAAIETLLAHHRSRVAFYRQMRESMAAAGNQPERRQAELKLADKQRLVAETEASLARLTLRADEPGEVVEALAKVGTPVKAGAPMLRVKTKLLHGDFALDAEERAEAPKLPFCRVEVVGLGPHASNGPEKPAPPAVADSAPAGAQAGPRFVDCRLGASPTDARPFRVSLPIDVGLVPGQPLRLARRRYDAVFPLPASAVTADGSDETRAAVWIARRSGTAERRAVVLAERADPALVSDGLQVGEDVIVDAPAGLTDGAPLSVIR